MATGLNVISITLKLQRAILQAEFWHNSPNLAILRNIQNDIKSNSIFKANHNYPYFHKVFVFVIDFCAYNYSFLVLWLAQRIAGNDLMIIQCFTQFERSVVSE